MNIDNVSNNDNFNILIVDDIADNLKVLGGILKNNGYKVRPVLNGEMALQVAEKEIPDLILLDIMMPGMNGYEVCSRLKRNSKLSEVPVIFISALNDTKDLVKAFDFGGVDYITKPFQAEEVCARVATHLTISKQRRELKELNATKDKFFSIIAHDLRGPISNMLLITEALADKESLDEFTYNSFLDLQKEISKDTLQLLENLLNWARSNTNQIEFNPAVFDVGEIISESIKKVLTASSNKNISVTENISSPCLVNADRNMVQLILRNLLSNAVKFTHQGGQIKISGNHIGNSVHVKIEDNGIGMGPEILENLFKINAKSKRHGTEGEISNGLGLLLCKEFVEKNGGKIWTESEEGKGSVFTISIPASSNL